MLHWKKWFIALTVVCFAAVTSTAQPPVENSNLTPTPDTLNTSVSVSAGVSHCDDMRRLIKNTRWAVRQSDWLIVDLGAKRTDAQRTADTFYNAAMDELKKPPGQFNFERYENYYFGYVTAQSIADELQAQIDAELFTRRCLLLLLREYEADYATHGCLPADILIPPPYGI